MKSIQRTTLAVLLLLMTGAYGCVCSQCPSCCSVEARYDHSQPERELAREHVQYIENQVSP